MEFEEEMGWGWGSAILYALHARNFLEFPWCLTHCTNWPHEVILTVLPLCLFLWWLIHMYV